MNQEDSEKAAIIEQLNNFVVKSAIVFLLDGKTLSELGFYEVLAESIDDESIKAVMDSPEKHRVFKATCLEVAKQLDRTLVTDNDEKSN